MSILQRTALSLVVLLSCGCVTSPKTPIGKVRAAEVVYVHLLDSLTALHDSGQMSDESKKEVVKVVVKIDGLFDLLDRHPDDPHTLSNINILIKELTEILVGLQTTIQKE